MARGSRPASRQGGSLRPTRPSWPDFRRRRWCRYTSTTRRCACPIRHGTGSISSDRARTPAAPSGSKARTSWRMKASLACCVMHSVITSYSTLFRRGAAWSPSPSCTGRRGRFDHGAVRDGRLRHRPVAAADMRLRHARRRRLMHALRDHPEQFIQVCRIPALFRLLVRPDDVHVAIDLAHPGAAVERPYAEES